MNYTLIFKSVGNMLIVAALFMLLPLAVSFAYGSGDHTAFLGAISISALAGTALSALKPKSTHFRTRDAFATVGLCWLFLSLFGALPFCFSGHFDSVIDCIFESISGFTTTGSSILTNVEILPKGIVFWRSLSHWIGGIGVLVFMLAVMPSVNASSIHILRAESTGPVPDKIVPRLRETAKIMCFIYLAMTILLVLLLYIAGLPVFDALINAFSVAGTGGFSNMNASIGAYNNLAAEIIISVFMFLFGISFSLYFILLGRKCKEFLMDEELRLYAGIVVAAIAVITINITGLYGSVTEALRYSSFQVASIISTTGFITADFNLWPSLSRVVLLFLMFTGCCAGSTGGGMKLVRILLLLKAAKNELNRIFHPGSVRAVSLSGKKVGQDVIGRIALFFFVYFALFFASVLLLSIEGTDIISSATAVISSLSNIGPGLGLVGPTGNYAALSSFSKMVLSFCMIAGRLEFFPMLILFAPIVWKRGLMK